LQRLTPVARGRLSRNQVRAAAAADPSPLGDREAARFTTKWRGNPKVQASPVARAVALEGRDGASWEWWR
jgi:hypothetical protein